MSDKEFNLLYEPWILTMNQHGKVEELSIIDVFRNAPNLKAIAGELPTQDVAVMRLLLAILHAVVGRYDLDGNYAPLCDADPESAINAWCDIWDMKEFPMHLIEKYLQKYEDRFWLFHPDTPFYQVAGLNKATEYTSSKLNGELSESGNKIRLFSGRSGVHKEMLTYAEAARWLLHLNAYDDTSAKPKGKDLPSPGAGWLGKLGLIFAAGNNLFQTLMLNLVLLKDEGSTVWGPEKPIWEIPVRSAERTEILQPNNLSELYTIQSRRLLLNRKDDKVTGYMLLGGDFFQKENAFNEPMTTWRNTAKKASDPDCYVPARHKPERQIWRDFSSIVLQQDKQKRPGIVSWIAFLQDHQILEQPIFCFQTPAAAYGDKDFFIDDIFNDSISFNIQLLSSIGDTWIPRILEELKTTDLLVAQLGFLAQNIAESAGNLEGNGQKANAMMSAYHKLDMQFRNWLVNIDPKQDDIEVACAKWWEDEVQIIRKLGKTLIEQAGPNAFIGKPGKITSTEAYNIFQMKTSSRAALTKGGKK